MVLANYIKLEAGVPKRMHFTSHTITERDITDPVTGLPTVRRALVFTVDREDGQPVVKQFSTLAEKLAVVLAPDLLNERYKDFEYTITQVGFGFRTRFQVEKQPLVRS